MRKFLKFFCSVIILLGADLQAYADTPKRPFFTVKQEEFFAQNMPVYAYFSELYVDKKTPAQIAKDYNLSEDTNLKYLKALGDIGVIKKVNRNNLSLPILFLV